jgi:hypothetical protein
MMSSVSGPPCFRLFSKNHKFFKNHKKKKILLGTKNVIRDDTDVIRDDTDLGQ